MYSVNVPVPGEVRRLAGDLYPELVEFEKVREEHTLLCKRLGDGRFERLAARARRALAGAPAFEARVTGIDLFERPPKGAGPVVYLTVESPGLHEVHDRLCETFDPVADLEGDGYTPHVTLARGGSLQSGRRLAEREIDPVTWQVSELQFWDPRYRERAGRVPLPA